MSKLIQVRYETPAENVNWAYPSIFLVGPTVRGNQPHLKSWRPRAVELLQDAGFEGNVIIPEFSNKMESDKYRYDLPIWENYGLRRSRVILAWVARTREQIALTTNFELGYWIAKDRNKIVYGRPDDSYRTMYDDLMWIQDAKERTMQTGVYCPAPIENTLEKLVQAALEKMNEFLAHDTLLATIGKKLPVSHET